ncbi:MAG: PilT/PilU family type 4a pilus ATPase [Sedimentisphaerales bacterium]|nr:PilT/PilU family type 4a pilus ATPase [Sedimentisphaerales bacterium]
MPIPTELQKILQLARREGASDIHIVAGIPPAMRINGQIVLVDRPPLTRQQASEMCMALLNPEQRKAFERDWQLCLALVDPQLGRFRVAVYLHAGSPEMSIRPVLDVIQGRDQLRLPREIEDLTRLQSGLILITGPTGSGKTTTMKFMIDLINSERRCKVITIEDPVEYLHRPKKAIIVQQELYLDVKSFAKALVHVLRQNPDVICIGEMRDAETTETALIAAETGHLVIATCHTPSVVQTAERIVAIFPESKQPQIYQQLANSLRAIIAQRLIPSASGRERYLAVELLLMNYAARKHIRDRQLHLLYNVMQTGGKVGMRTMDDSLMELYQQGLITYESMLSNAEHPSTIRSRLEKGLQQRQ